MFELHGKPNLLIMYLCILDTRFFSLDSRSITIRGSHLNMAITTLLVGIDARSFLGTLGFIGFIAMGGSRKICSYGLILLFILFAIIMLINGFIFPIFDILILVVKVLNEFTMMLSQQ